MKKNIIFTFVFLILSHSGFADTIDVFPIDVSYWTGSCSPAVKTETSEVRGFNEEDGWMMFDISSIPDGSTVSNVVFYGYVNATIWPFWSVTPVTNDPLTASPDVLNADITDEAESGFYLYRNEDSGFSTGWKTHLLGGSILSDLESSLISDRFTIGIATRDSSPDYYIIFDGWMELSEPFLRVDYVPAGTPTPDPTATPTPTQTPFMYTHDYAVISIRTIDTSTGASGDADSTTLTTTTLDIRVITQNVGLLSEELTVTVTDPGLPGWSAVGYIASILPGDCMEISVSPDWPDSFTPMICGNHRLVATLSDDDDASNNTLEKSIEIPDSTFETILQIDNWNPGQPIGNAGFYDTPDELIVAVEFVAPFTGRINAMMFGILNSKFNQFGWVDWPDAALDPFGAVFMRDSGGEPLLPADSTELNLYTLQDSIGHFNVVETYWAPECSLTVTAGEVFYVGFKNLDNCTVSDPGYEALCSDDNGLANGYVWVYDPGPDTWFQDSWVGGDPIIHIGMTSLGPTPTPAVIGDQCSNAVDISPEVNTGVYPQTILGSTLGAVDDYRPTTCSLGSGGDLVYRFTPDTDRELIFDLCDDPHTLADSVLYVRSSGSCPGTMEINCNDDGCGIPLMSSLDCMQYQTGETYYLIVDTYDENTIHGDFVLTVTDCVMPTPTPTATPVCIHNGDIDFNGSLTAGDAQVAFYIALGTYIPTFYEACAADCDDNGTVTAGDAQTIFYAALGTGSCIDPV